MKTCIGKCKYGKITKLYEVSKTYHLGIVLKCMDCIIEKLLTTH